MLIARLTVSYDRGLQRNKPDDVGLESEPQQTPNGGIVRGLGTHWRSDEARLIVREKDRENARIRDAFRQKFLLTPLDGVYFIPQRGAARAFVQTLRVRSDVEVRVVEFQLTSEEGLDPSSVREWADRVKRQIEEVPLGRGKEADAGGLDALESLASCPAIAGETGERIRELVASVRLQKLDRIELKRALGMVSVKIDTTVLAPRRAPIVPEEVPVA